MHDVDALRGFALIGIFVVNITFMASGYPGNLVADPAFSSTADDVVRTLSSVLVDMKFYLLFSFLFGYSFMLQADAARRAGAAFAPRMLRRIAGLFVLGALHFVFLSAGDILATYAVVCLVLFWMRGIRDRTALRVAAAVYGVVLLSALVGSLFLDSSAFLPSGSEALASAERTTGDLLGGWSSVIAAHLRGLPLLLIQSASLQGPTALAMFLLGVVASRRRLFSRITGDDPVLRKTQLIGFPIGLAGGVLYALGGGNGNTLAVTASVATAPLLTAAYVATLLRVLHNPRTAGVRAALAPAGRMALTNYLAQSLFGILVFTGIGLGAAGSLSPLALAGLAVLFFVFQMAASALWLRVFQYGPAEWVLRWITNARRPAWRSAGNRGVP
ncbi:DUF418 domain-containing protein [Amycolatopsis silviterrae]|uniref:DUF418 domain-containing protein n=1 Tax=Amycolatopsis silviterrae TaxID=1656914 RepID=A0ABW5H2X3_9PSEU